MFPVKDDIPTRRFPVLTVAIIAICCVVYFLFEHGLWDLGQTGNERVLEYGAIPYEITHPGKSCAEALGQVVCEGQPGVTGTAPDQAPWWVTLFTSMFMHASLIHLAGNMLFLWIFGNNIEDRFGRLRFLAFYLVGGIVAGLTQVAIDPTSTVPTIGASGAIAAVLGAYLVLFPRARVTTAIFLIFFYQLIDIPAVFVLGFWFVLQLFDGLGSLGAMGAATTGGVAFFAHIGGFVFGAAIALVYQALTGGGRPGRSVG